MKAAMLVAAIAALLAILAVALAFFRGAIDQGGFRGALVALSLVYFVCATAYATRRSH